jgi:hypothetical protein
MLFGVLTRERPEFLLVAPLQLRHSLGMLPNFPEYSFSSLPCEMRYEVSSIVFL